MDTAVQRQDGWEFQRSTVLEPVLWKSAARKMEMGRLRAKQRGKSQWLRKDAHLLAGIDVEADGPHWLTDIVVRRQGGWETLDFTVKMEE